LGYTTIGYTIQTGMSKSIYSKEYKNIIEMLKTARLDVGMKQEDVASKLKKPQSYISKIERGERRVDAAELKELAKILKKDVSYFLS
jgi:transcriptional regulator with XRE-family HTH domain